MQHVFPKWFYHQEQMPEGQIIHSQEQFDALGKGWVHSPAEFEQKLESVTADNGVEANALLVEPKPRRSRKPQEA